MTNEEVFKTIKERDDAFVEFCNAQNYCGKCPCFSFNPFINKKNCAFKWLALEYKKPHRTMEKIIEELKEISKSSRLRSSYCFANTDVTIKGKVVHQYFSDLANEIETAWNRSV